MPTEKDFTGLSWADFVMLPGYEIAECAACKKPLGCPAVDSQGRHLCKKCLQELNCQDQLAKLPKLESTAPCTRCKNRPAAYQCGSSQKLCSFCAGDDIYNMHIREGLIF